MENPNLDIIDQQEPSLEQLLPLRAITRNPENQDPDLISSEYWQNMLDLQEMIDLEMPQVVSSHESFIAFMKRCHQIACSGKNGDRSYSGVTDVNLNERVGKFRIEPTSMGGYDLATKAINGIDPLLHQQFLSDTPQVPVNQQAVIPGLEKYANTEEPEVLGVASRYTFKHPKPEAIEAYQKLACDTADEIIKRTGEIDFNSATTVDQQHLLNLIADYYRIQIIALPFDAVNNSILMGQTNYFLNKLGISSIPHRAFDFEASRLNPQQWRERFLHILETESKTKINREPIQFRLTR